LTKSFICIVHDLTPLQSSIWQTKIHGKKRFNDFSYADHLTCKKMQS